MDREQDSYAPKEEMGRRAQDAGARALALALFLRKMGLPARVLHRMSHGAARLDLGGSVELRLLGDGGLGVLVLSEGDAGARWVSATVPGGGLLGPDPGAAPGGPLRGKDLARCRAEAYTDAQLGELIGGIEQGEAWFVNWTFTREPILAALRELRALRAAAAPPTSPHWRTCIQGMGRYAFPDPGSFAPGQPIGVVAGAGEVSDAAFACFWFADTQPPKQISIWRALTPEEADLALAEPDLVWRQGVGSPAAALAGPRSVEDFPVPRSREAVLACLPDGTGRQLVWQRPGSEFPRYWANHWLPASAGYYSVGRQAPPTDG